MRYLLILIAMGLPLAAEAKMPVAVDGEARAVIVIAPDASPQVQKAAETLQHYLKASTGAAFPIQTESGDGSTIYVGDTSRGKVLVPDTLDEEGFILKGIDNRSFVIAGGSDWGTEFGVYDFLERYVGVRWLMPTKIGTVVPARKTLNLPLEEIREEPVFLNRRLSPIEVERDFSNPARWKQAPWKQYLPADEWGRFNRTRWRLAYHHNLYKLFPPSRYAATHPEFYPVIKGKRRSPKGDGDAHSWQPNFSAEGIVEEAVKNIEAYFESHPKEKSYSLAVNDLRAFDESPESKARRSGKINAFGYEDVSDDYFEWANAVVTQVRKRYPDHSFGMLAYSSVLEPPERVGVAKGIVPFLTLERLRWGHPESRKQDQDFTLSWGKHAEVIGWYDYIYGSSYMLPRLWPHLMKEYLQWGAQHQVRHYVAELYPNWGTGPKTWVAAKLLWNPDRDVDALLGEWYRSAVGEAAAPKLAAYYAIWEKFWSSDIQKHERVDDAADQRWYRRTGQYLPFDIPSYLREVPDALLSDSRQLMDETVALAGTPEEKARAEKLREMWRLYEVCVRVYRAESLWRSNQPGTEQEALAFLAQCEAALSLSAERMQMLEGMGEDLLYGHSAYRILRSANTKGAEWGASPLWAILPWVPQSEAVRGRLEVIAKEGATEAGRKVAGQVLKAAQQNGEGLLGNGDFEQRLRGWHAREGVWFQEQAQSGNGSVRFTGVNGQVLQQSRPITMEADYYATVSTYHLAGAKGNGSAVLSLATTDRADQARGRELPAVKLPLQEGKWRTVVIPFTVERMRIPEVQLRVRLTLEGFAEDEGIVVDDLQIYPAR